MTDHTLVALIAVIPPTLTALAGLLVSVRNGRKTDKVSEKAEDASAKADTLVSGQKEIHALVNSNLAKVKAELEEARAEIRESKAETKALRELVATLMGKIAGGES